MNKITLAVLAQLIVTFIVTFIRFNYTLFLFLLITILEYFLHENIIKYEKVAR